MADDFDLAGRLRVDFSELEEIPERTEAAVAAADGQQIAIQTEVDDRQATRSFRDTDLAIARLDKAVARPTIEVDGSQADRTIANLRAQFAALDTRIEKLRVDAAGDNLPGEKGTILAGRSTSNFAKYAQVAAVATVAVAAIAGVKQTYGATVPRVLEEAKGRRAVTRSFGADQGQEFLAASEALADATGFLAQDFREAALAGKTLAAMSDEPAKAARLQTEAIKQLLPVAADIAATSPDKQLQSVSGAFGALKLALAGNASAQERLGVDLSDAHMQTRAFGGALRNTWADLTAAEQAQLRYKEILAQTSDIMGEAGDETGLEYQMREFKRQAGELALKLGTELAPSLLDLMTAINQLVEAIPDWMITLAGAVIAAPARAVTATIDPFNLNLPQPETTTISGAKAHAAPGLSRARPGYYPPTPGPSAVAPTGIQVSLNVRREPGTTINLDSASYAPSNV